MKVVSNLYGGGMDSALVSMYIITEKKLKIKARFIKYV